jgi:DegV family protein with EDD domain
MKDFQIFTDSCSDLPIEYMREKGIEFASLSCSYNGQEYKDDFGQSLSHKKFFGDLRNGAIPLSSQPSVDEFYKKFRAIADKKKDILYVCVSTGLSGTENCATIAKQMVLDENPEVNIEIVNTLTASLGQGLMVMRAVEMKEAGKTLKEIASYIEDSKQRLNTYMTVDDLSHLKRGGRISLTAAVLGMVLHIKPILTINNEGRVMALLKVRGRKGSIAKLAETLAERIENPEQQTIAICHGDCIDEAMDLKESILKLVKVKDVIINYTGPAVGTHGGPGNLAIFFMGKERQQHLI